MTELLERAVETVRALPPEAQDALAGNLLQLTGGGETVIPLTSEEEASLDEALPQAERGEFATDEQVCAPFGRSMGCEAPLHAPRRHRTIPPKRIRQPADFAFASCCSPPRLPPPRRPARATVERRSYSRLHMVWLNAAGDSHPADKNPQGRTVASQRSQ
jgi:hypothetical protein